MKKTNQVKSKGSQSKPASSGLMGSVSQIHKVRSREEVAMSDGGGTGRSDKNDNSNK